MSEDVSWYYSDNGTRTGPVSVDAMRQLAQKRILSNQTMVWRAGMGDWLPLYQTELASLVSWPLSPPPLMGEAVNNGVVWTVAFVPILSVFLQLALAGPLGTPAAQLWYIAPILNVILCLVDEANLKKAGHDTKGMGAWAFFLVPVYLFVRAARLKQSNGYAIVWLVTFALSLFLPATL